jgi:hypothetical protein
MMFISRLLHLLDLHKRHEGLHKVCLHYQGGWTDIGMSKPVSVFRPPALMQEYQVILNELMELFTQQRGV